MNERECENARKLRIRGNRNQPEECGRRRNIGRI